MFKIEEIPFYLYVVFMTLYFAVGNSDDTIWSGLFFCFNYIVLFWSFLTPKSKRIKQIGVSLSFSLFIFSLVKFFIYPQIEKYCIFILFIIAIISNIYLQKRK